MTTIRTTCREDGEVDLAPDEVEIAADEMSYTFICPKCKQYIIKPADQKIIRLLRSADVKTEPIEAPVITNQDILQFSSNIDEEIARLLG